MSNESKIISSFSLQETLNPIIWDKYENPEEATLKVDIRKKLLEIAHEFMDFIDIEFFVDDIVLTGSLSNFNWSEFSDIDLHLEVDFTQFDKDSVELYRELFNLKKLLFNTNHNIRIHGFETELYVQDIIEEHTSGGIYSILFDKWLITPTKKELSIDKNILKRKIKNWTSQIDNLIQQSDDLDYDESIELIKNLRDKLKKYRKTGLEKGGEFSYENLVFKYLRRGKYIEKLFELTQKLKDKKLSLESLNEDVNPKIKILVFQYLDIVLNDCAILQDSRKDKWSNQGINVVNVERSKWYINLAIDGECYIDGNLRDDIENIFGDIDGLEMVGQYINEKLPFNVDLDKLDEEYDDNMFDDIIENSQYIETNIGNYLKETPKPLKEDFISPIPSITITSNYDEQRSGYKHKGVDLRVPSGTKVVNIEDGIVIDAAIRNDACGGTLYIDHQNGFKSRYCHLKQINVKKGDKVSKNQTLGLSGGNKNDVGRGTSTGSHLHFELYKNRKTVNPIEYLSGAKTTKDTINQSTEKSFFDKLMTFIFGENIGKTTKQNDFITNLEEIISKKENIKKSLKPTYNKDVGTVQSILQLIGYSLPKWGVDGKFGNETERAVLKFQKDNNLEETGVVTMETLKKLLHFLSTKEIKPEDIDNIRTTPSTTETIIKNGKFAMNFFINKGLTREQAAGIVGNLQAESNLNPHASGDSSTSFGIAQWHKNRMKKLIDWSTNNNKNVYDITTQLEFLWVELTTSFKNVLTELKSIRTVDQATIVFASKYEKPKSKDYTKRIKYAKTFYNLE
jgi:predicted nucleotidyltransferase